MVATPLAKLRHIIDLLPLLPSGPGGVHRVQLRGTSGATIAKQSIEIFKRVATLLWLFQQVFVSID